MKVFYVAVVLVYFVAGETMGSELGRYVESVPWFESVDNSKISGNPIVNKRAEDCTVNTLHIERSMIGQSDFCFEIEVESVDTQLVYMPGANRYTGLGVTRGRIVEDKFYGQTGEVDVIWIGLDIPNIVISDPPRDFGLDRMIGKRFYVFGYMENGFRVAIKDYTCRVDSDNEIVSIFGMPVSSRELENFIELRNSYSWGGGTKSGGNLELVRLDAVERVKLDGGRNSVSLNKLDPETGAVVGSLDVVLADEWAAANSPTFEPGVNYVIKVHDGNEDGAVLHGGKLNVWPIEEDRLLGTSEIAVGRVIGGDTLAIWGGEGE